MLVLAILAVAVVLLLLVYINGKYNETYWKKRGVAFCERSKAAGPFWEYLFQEQSMFQLFEDIYKEYPNEPAVGLGSFFTPALYVKDPVNVNHVMHTNFQSFNHRGLAFNDDDKLANNVLMLHGPKWKVIRQNMTPLFTTTKLKNMYYIIDKSAQDFVYFLKNNPSKLRDNGFETLNTYCCAALSAAVFGIGVESTFDSPFIQYVKDALHPTLWKNIKFAISNLNRSIFMALRLSLFSVHEDWFIGAIKKVLRERERENVKKHDFADLCISLQKNGPMKDHDTGYEVEPTDEILAAQAFFYYIAGLEPCASAFYSAIIELGRNPEMLQKVHDEIDEVFKKHNNEVPYDAVVEMEYLEKVLNEAMRMYPPIGFLTRECVEDSVLPVGNIKVQKGTKIFTPIYEYHHDPQYFDDPEVFNPERFSREEKNNGVYMPFGKGNRICIGVRYAKLQVKAGMMHVLRHFTVKTLMQKGGIKYQKEQVQVRLTNVNFEFIPRKLID